MKKIYLLAFAFLLGFNLYSQRNNGKLVYEPVLKTDRIIEYTWDNEKSEWLLKNSIKYNYTYENGEAQEVITSDFFTGDPISKIIHSYTPKKILEESLFQIWTSEGWINTRRDLWFSNDEGLTIEAVIQFWQNDAWVNKIRYTDYQYENRKLQQYTYQSWVNEQWIDSYYDAWYYDENGYLILRQTTGVNNIPQTKYVYSLGENNLRQSLAFSSWLNGNWVEYSRRLYEYNQCGKTNAVVYQIFKDGSWVNTTRDEYIYSLSTENINFGAKVPVCHNGNTIYVSINAVEAHLAHGDCIGECMGKKESGKYGVDEKIKPEKPPFTIYPNPAKEKITIKFNNDECEESKRVELTDFFGRLIKSFNVKGNSDLTIYREKLLSGKYYVRLIGEEAYSAMVIFE